MILETIYRNDYLLRKISAIAKLKTILRRCPGNFKRQLMQAAGQHLSCSISEFGGTGESPKKQLEKENHKVVFKKSELAS